MPRRNLHCLLIVTVLTIICYNKFPQNRYSHILADTLDHVTRHYYVPVDDKKMFEGAMKGMISHSLLDDNSDYKTAANKQEFEEEINKQFGGIGASVGVSPKTKQVMIIGPMPGSPAARAGLLPGDKILKINGEATQGMSLHDTVERLRGQLKAPLALQILHAGETRPIEVTIVRAVIHEDTVQGYQRDADGAWDYHLPGHEGIGYINILGFAESDHSFGAGEKVRSTAADLREVMETLSRGNLRGVVLDLRGNPGGALRAAIDVCDLFIAKGTIVTIRGRDGKIQQAAKASGTAPFTQVPLAVLVNQHSASASEIVSACLQDCHRAVIVGQRTFGKGTVQEVVDLGPGLGILKLTIATYWRPSGKNIHRHKDDGKNAAWGVTPDAGYEVIVDDDELAKSGEWHRVLENRKLAPPAYLSEVAVDEVPDRPLARALEYLEKSGAKK